MTEISTTEIACPECDLEQLFSVYNSVNVSLNPDYKEKLINGELTILTCDACGYQVEMVYPMLYHDMENKLMIYFFGKQQIVVAYGQKLCLDAAHVFPTNSA